MTKNLNVVPLNLQGGWSAIYGEIFSLDNKLRKLRSTLNTVGIYMTFGPSIPVHTCIYTDTRLYGVNTYDD